MAILNDRGRLAVEETHRMKITEARVDVPLSYALVRGEIPAEARVIGRTMTRSR